MNHVSRFFSRVGAACSFFEDLFSGDPPLDPLDEDPHYVLTRGERASIRARRDAVTDPLIRADMTHLLTAVEYLGRLREEDAESAERFADVAPDSEPSKPTLATWLAEPWTNPLPWPPEMDPIMLVTGANAPTKAQVLAALVGMNGGTLIKQYGTFETGGPYGRLGLSIDEVVVLTQLNGFMLGWSAATGENTTAVEKLLSEEIVRASTARVKAAYSADELHPVKTMKVTATELYVDGKKVADVNDLETRDPRDGGRRMCSFCKREHFPGDSCQA